MTSKATTNRRTQLSQQGASKTVVASTPGETQQTSEVLNEGEIRKPKHQSCIPIDPIPEGLTIVFTNSKQVHGVRNVFIREVSRCGNNFGLPMPQNQQVTSLHSGYGRHLEIAVNSYAANMTANKTAKDPLYPIFKKVGTKLIYDHTSDEGQAVLLPIIEESSSGTVMLEQHISSPLSSNITNGLINIRHKAKLAGVRLIMFLVTPSEHEKTYIDGLSEYCFETISIIPCEPDPDSESAFAIDIINLHPLLMYHVVVCNVRWSNGQYHRRFSPFVSTEWQKRAAWILYHYKNKSIADIGEILKIDKSNVSRKLKGLPNPYTVNKKFDMDWLQTFMETTQGALATADDD